MSHVHYISQGSGEPLIFQHGLTASIQQIFGLLGKLPKVNLLSMDCPGHGKAILPVDYIPSFNRYSDDLVDISRRQNVNKAFFGGLSMGAGIALNVASRYPEMVKGLILLRPAWLWSPCPENLVPLLEASSVIGQSDYVSSLHDIASFNIIKVNVPKAAQSILGIFSKSQQSCLPSVIRHMVHDKPVSSVIELDRLNIPCLIIVNDHDPLHPVSIGEILSEKIKYSSLVKVVSRYLDPELHRSEVRRSIVDL